MSDFVSDSVKDASPDNLAKDSAQESAASAQESAASAQESAASSVEATLSDAKDAKDAKDDTELSDLFTESLTKLSLSNDENEEKRKEIWHRTIYFSLKFLSEEVLAIIIPILKEICPDYLEKYEIQTEFHITVLFIKKETEPNFLLVDLLGKEYTATVVSIGISEDFIVLGVSNINDEDGNDMPYYGNPIKHITIGKRKDKELQPANSYLALDEKNSTMITFSPVEKLKGTLGNVSRNVSKKGPKKNFKKDPKGKK